MQEKNSLRGVQPGLTHTGLYSLKRKLGAKNFEFVMNRKCTIHVGKTKALISCAVTAHLICTFVFA